MDKNTGEEKPTSGPRSNVTAAATNQMGYAPATHESGMTERRDKTHEYHQTRPGEKRGHSHRSIQEHLEISISKAAVIHAGNNLDSHFWPYIAILSHDNREIKRLSTPSELTKALEDEQLRLLNENSGTANYACSSKPKEVEPSEQREKEE